MLEELIELFIYGVRRILMFLTGGSSIAFGLEQDISNPLILFGLFAVGVAVGRIAFVWSLSKEQL